MALSKKAFALTVFYILIVAFQSNALAAIRATENQPRESEVDKRRLVMCLDGTWNSPHDEKKIDDGRQLLFKPTNVLKTCRSVLPIGDDGVVQLIYYASGVGSAARFPGAANTVYAYMDKYLGGVWGAGFESNVVSALTYLTMNYQEGDEVFLFGFSRGAATARGVTQFLRWAGGVPKREDAYWLPFLFRSFIDHDGEDFPPEDKSDDTDSQDDSRLIFDSQNSRKLPFAANTEENVTPSCTKPFSCDNIVKSRSTQANVQRFDEERCQDANEICASYKTKNCPESCKIKAFNKVDIVEVPIKFLGVWDTVMALGSRFEATGDTTTSSPSQSFYVSDHPAPAVEVARQALAIDERRYDFRPEIWTSHLEGQDMKQRWFPGVHSNVGGGYVHDGLANGAFHWILGEAEEEGLKVDTCFAGLFEADPEDTLYHTYTLGAELIDTIRRRRDKGIRDLAAGQRQDASDNTSEDSDNGNGSSDTENTAEREVPCANGNGSKEDERCKIPEAKLELDRSVCDRLAALPGQLKPNEEFYRPDNVRSYFVAESPKSPDAGAVIKEISKIEGGDTKELLKHCLDFVVNLQEVNSPEPSGGGAR